MILLLVALQQPTVTLTPGMVITRSVRVAPRTYRLAGAPIVIRGSNITVDFGNATLQGADPAADPDAGADTAIVIDGGTNVRVRRANIRGYKVGILARGTRGLTIENVDASYNWKPRLYSLIEHESLVDWLSYHRNEAGEWLRFGAGIYLDRVTGGTIQNNKVQQGMNGLLMNRTDSLRILLNDFSFNSGLGIGMYRSSFNTIMHNTVEFNVRGYSHGFYRRGQDSAGILMYEQCNHNVVAYNSVTHGGDGLFVWAGQTTMDSGTGGVNDNLFYRNDFSWAPTNGMEATFSRNTFAENLIRGSDHGLWGGYSYSSRIIRNTFRNNRVGIAIEHGQDNVIVRNTFDGDTTAIYLWANPIEPSDWGYPRHRDTRGRDYRMSGNTFRGNRVALRFAQTLNASFGCNEIAMVDSLIVSRDSSRTSTPACTDDEPAVVAPVPIRGRRAEIPRSAIADMNRSAIVVDEWGPYDWRSPKLWPIDSSRATPLRLRVLGPPGRWTAVARRGVADISSIAGRMGDTISVTPHADSTGDWEITLEYRGAATLSPRGIATPANRPVRFSYGRFEPRIDWAARFFVWDTIADPRTHADAFARVLAGTPVLTRTVPRLDYMWYRPTIRELPQERWALEATATVNLNEAATLRTISDDGIRVWIDGVMVIDRWTLHESAVDAAPLPPGRHELKVQFFQIGGWTELRVDILRGAQRAGGSPGPH